VTDDLPMPLTDRMVHLCIDMQCIDALIAVYRWRYSEQIETTDAAVVLPKWR
jgi:hypothetical protein